MGRRLSDEIRFEYRQVVMDCGYEWRTYEHSKPTAGPAMLLVTRQPYEHWPALSAPPSGKSALPTDCDVPGGLRDYFAAECYRAPEAFVPESWLWASYVRWWNARDKAADKRPTTKWEQYKRPSRPWFNRQIQQSGFVVERNMGSCCGYEGIGLRKTFEYDPFTDQPGLFRLVAALKDRNDVCRFASEYGPLKYDHTNSFLRGLAGSFQDVRDWVEMWWDDVDHQCDWLALISTMTSCVEYLDRIYDLNEARASSDLDRDTRLSRLAEEESAYLLGRGLFASREGDFWHIDSELKHDKKSEIKHCTGPSIVLEGVRQRRDWLTFTVEQALAGASFGINLNEIGNGRFGAVVRPSSLVEVCWIQLWQAFTGRVSWKRCAVCREFFPTGVPSGHAKSSKETCGPNCRNAKSRRQGQ